MTDRAFVDTNIIVYLFDLAEKEKRPKATELISTLIDKQKPCISVQVLNEFINVVTKKIENKLSSEELIKRIEVLNEIFFIAPIKYTTTRKALELQVKYQFSFWDSLIIASAIENECKIIYSEDFQHKQVVENRIVIINPFLNK